jgi:hypothetical protein
VALAAALAPAPAIVPPVARMMTFGSFAGSAAAGFAGLAAGGFAGSAASALEQSSSNHDIQTATAR